LGVTAAGPHQVDTAASAVAWYGELSPGGGPEVTGRPLQPPRPAGRNDPVDAEEARALGQWAARLAATDLSHIQIAVERLLRAVWEPESSESLIDAVISWENLVGTRQETSYRVTGALAVLCEDNPAMRLARRRQLARVYDARSRLVHGDSPDGSVGDFREEALRVGLIAIERLVERPPDLLALPKSSDRADRLLLGVAAEPPETDVDERDQAENEPPPDS
jgi:hypothetical protein